MPLSLKNTCWLCLLTSPLLFNCGGSRTLYDYDTKARFEAYDTFHWLEDRAGATQVIEPVDQALRKAITYYLEARGLRLVDGEGDLAVAYHVGDKAPIAPGDAYAYWPARWGYGGYYGGAATFPFPRGTLIVDLIDRRKNRLVWRGSTPKAIRQAALEKQAARIDEAVAELLAQYPPRIYE